MEKRRLVNIFIIVFIDLLGFGLILPLLPFYADVYGASATLVGVLTAVYPGFQLVGAPFLGRMSDRYGRRPVLLISIFGTFVGFLVLGLADPLGRWAAGVIGFSVNATILALLFLSRAIDGLTGGNISVAQAYITDITDEKNRARGLGLVGAAFGLGFVLGPAIGGVTSRWGYDVPAFVAAGLSAVNLIMVALWLPESLPPSERVQQVARRVRVGVQSFVEAIRRPYVGSLLQMNFWYRLSFAIFETVFSLFALYRLGLDAQGTGYILTYVGVLLALVQGGGIGVISKRFEDRWILLISSMVLILALVGWAGAVSIPLLLLVLAPLALAGGVFSTISRSALTKAVHADEVGGTLGISSSLESVTRMIAPVLGGLVLDHIGTWAPGVLGALIMTWVSIFVWLEFFRKSPQPSLQKEQGKGIPGGG